MKKALMRWGIRMIIRKKKLDIWYLEQRRRWLKWRLQHIERSQIYRESREFQKGANER